MGYENENAFVLPPAPQVPYLVFDIETVPSPDCAQYLTEPISAPANYKDEAKIAAYIATAKQKQIDEAGLDLDLCEIAAIGWEGEEVDGIYPGGISLRGFCDERTMLRDFWRATEGKTLVGFNVLHFDLLVLLRRSLYLGVTAPKIAVDRYRHEGVIDLADTLSFGRRDLLRSLDFYCKRLGIAHDDTVTGADIAKLVAAGNWKRVSEHCYDDVRATKEMAVRLGLIRAAVAA